MANIRTQVEIPVGKKAGGKKNSYKATFVSFDGLNDDKEHVALVFKGLEKNSGFPQSIHPLKKEPVVRIHSECLTGDIFHSARCDCGDQLNEAIESMAQTGGIILYLRQEGRGIGLYNKLDAYVLQDEGYDTYAANRKLGFEDDLRDFSIAGQMLEALGINKVRLLTNNPQKVAALQVYGIDVIEQQPTGVFHNPHNDHYLRAKADVSQHTIHLPQEKEMALA